MDPIEHIFVDGHLVGHIAQDAASKHSPRTAATWERI